MKKNILFIAVVFLLSACAHSSKMKNGNGWISLYDGKSFDGWKFSEKQGSFTIEDSCIKVAGVRSHLFYDGPVMNHNFKNFVVL